MLLLLYLIIYLSLIYFKLAKPYFVKHPVQIRSDLFSIFKNRYDIYIMAIINDEK